MRAQDVEGPAEHGTEVEVRLVQHPAIGTGSIQVNVRAKIAKHQRFAEVTGAEVGDDKTDLWIAECKGVQIDRVGVAHVEEGREAKFLPDPDAEYSTMDESDGLMRSGKVEERRDARVVHGIAVHGGEEAQTMEAAGL